MHCPGFTYVNKLQWEHGEGCTLQAATARHFHSSDTKYSCGGIQWDCTILQKERVLADSIQVNNNNNNLLLLFLPRLQSHIYHNTFLHTNNLSHLNWMIQVEWISSCIYSTYYGVQTTFTGCSNRIPIKNGGWKLRDVRCGTDILSEY